MNIEIVVSYVFPFVVVVVKPQKLVFSMVSLGICSCCGCQTTVIGVFLGICSCCGCQTTVIGVFLGICSCCGCQTTVIGVFLGTCSCCGCQTTEIGVLYGFTRYLLLLWLSNHTHKVDHMLLYLRQYLSFVIFW